MKALKHCVCDLHLHHISNELRKGRDRCSQGRRAKQLYNSTVQRSIVQCSALKLQQAASIPSFVPSLRKAGEAELPLFRIWLIG